MITNKQVRTVLKVFYPRSYAPCDEEIELMRKALEEYEASKWVKFDIPCDICEKELDYHPKHFSSSTNPHVHVCDACISELNYERFFIDSTPPTREPLSEDTLWHMWVGSLSDALVFARAIEQAHGIN